MFLVLRRGAVGTLERAAVLGGAAAVACVRSFQIDPEWRERPGKVCLRARNPAQWAAVLEEPHALAGDPAGESVAALPPRRRSERGPLLERLQAMSSDLGPAPTELADGDGVTYVLNPELDMSSGKVVAQVAHAAVMAAEALPDWAAAGAPGRLVAPRGFAALAARDDLAARVIDAGLTEVAPGTVTVLALPPRG
jgi:peptidyl-tRNA hydrolase PTH2